MFLQRSEIEKVSRKLDEINNESNVADGAYHNKIKLGIHKSLNVCKELYKTFGDLLIKLENFEKDESNKLVIKSHPQIKTNFSIVYYNVASKFITIAKDMAFIIGKDKEKETLTSLVVVRILDVCKKLYNVICDEKHLSDPNKKIIPLSISLQIMLSSTNVSTEMINNNLTEAKKIYSELGTVDQKDVNNVIEACRGFGDAGSKIDNIAIAKKWFLLAFHLAIKHNFAGKLFSVYLSLANVYRKEFDLIVAPKRSNNDFYLYSILEREKPLWEQIKQYCTLAMEHAAQAETVSPTQASAFLKLLDDIIAMHIDISSDTSFHTALEFAHIYEDFILVLSKLPNAKEFDMIQEVAREKMAKYKKGIPQLIDILNSDDSKEWQQLVDNLQQLEIAKEKEAKAQGEKLEELEENAKKLHDRSAEKLDDRACSRAKKPKKSRKNKAAQARRTMSTANALEVDSSASNTSKDAEQPAVTLEQKYCSKYSNYDDAKRNLLSYLYDQAICSYGQLLVVVRSKQDLIAEIIILSEMADCYRGKAINAFKHYEYYSCANYYKQTYEFINEAINKLSILMHLEHSTEQKNSDTDTIYYSVKLSAENVKKNLDSINNYIPHRKQFRTETRKIFIKKAQALGVNYYQQKKFKDFSKKARELHECKKAMPLIRQLLNNADFLQKRLERADRYFETQTEQPQILLQREVNLFNIWMEDNEQTEVLEDDVLNSGLSIATNLADKFYFIQDFKMAYLYFTNAYKIAGLLKLTAKQTMLMDKAVISYDNVVVLQKCILESENSASDTKQFNILKKLSKLAEYYQQVMALYQRLVTERNENIIHLEEKMEQVQALEQTTLQKIILENIQEISTIKTRINEIMLALEEIKIEKIYFSARFGNENSGLFPNTTFFAKKTKKPFWKKPGHSVTEYVTFTNISSDKKFDSESKHPSVSQESLKETSIMSANSP